MSKRIQMNSNKQLVMLSPKSKGSKRGLPKNTSAKPVRAQNKSSSLKGIKSGSGNNSLVSFVKKENIPIVYSQSIKMKSQKTRDLGSGNLRLQHQELVTEIVTAKTTDQFNGFNLIKIHVNPGLTSSFPWLSSLARNYLNYQFSQLELCFIPRNSVTKEGSVMMFAEYDPSASDPENRKDFLNRKHAQENQVFKQMVFSCDISDLRKEKAHYIRVGKPTNNQDIKLLDACTMYFAYEGTLPNLSLGDLFWQYTVDLITPNLHLGRNLINSIESTRADGVNNTATDALPLGVMTASSFLGNFAGALLNTATGGLAGQFFSTGKTILKFIQGFFPTPVSGAVPNQIGLQILEKKQNVDDFVSIIYTDEDDLDLLSLASNEVSELALLNDFNDISASNVLKTVDVVDNPSGNRVTNFLAAIPANAIFRFYAETTGHPSTGAPSIIMVDANASSIGLLSSFVHINFN